MHPAEIITVDQPRPRKRRLALLVVSAVVVVLAGGGILGYALLRPEPPAEEKVRANCRAAVLERLRAPGTAQFVGEPEVIDNGFRYFVEGQVDSENGFGALLRSNYTCMTGKNSTAIDEVNVDTR